MIEISKEEYDLEEYKEQLKFHDCWCKYSWQVDICKQALKDREMLEKIEQVIDDIEDYEHEDFEFDIRLIEQIVKGGKNEID